MEGFCSVGTPPEHKTETAISEVYIGSRNKINEHTTINAGTHERTFIGDDCYIMRGVHIGHDAYIAERVTLSCNVIIGGHTAVMRGANMGLGSAVHQNRVIGAYAMIGMMSNVVRSIPPFVTALGNPCKPIKINAIGMARGGFSDQEISDAAKWFNSPAEDADLYGQLFQHIDQWKRIRERHGL